MNSHKNARTTLQGRILLIERIGAYGLTPAAKAAGISVRTAHKWRQRLEQETSGESHGIEANRRRHTPLLTSTQLLRSLATRHARFLPPVHSIRRAADERQ